MKKYNVDELTASKEVFDAFVEAEGDKVIKALYENKDILALLIAEMLER